MPKAPEKARKSPSRMAKSVSTTTLERPSKAAKPTPPAASDSAERAAVKRPQTFEDVIGELTGPVREIARQLRQLIFDVLPGATETAYGGSKVQLVLYSLGGATKTVCGIQPNGPACLLYLHHVSPEDSQTLLIEGQGKHSQHVRVEAMTNLIVRDLRRLLSLAKRRAKA